MTAHSPLAFGPYLGGLDARPDSSENDEEEAIYTRTSRLVSSSSSSSAVRATTTTTTTPTGTPTLSTPTQSSVNVATSATTTTTTSSSLRHRFFTGLNYSFNFKPRSTKTISTTPGQLGAGETETEADEPLHRLPTARIVHSSGPLVPPNTLQQRLTPLLFEFSRLLAVVPAVIGTLYNLYHAYNPPTTPDRKRPERIDFFVSALWAILTGYQCLALTTGLLTRWRLYYAPLSTLVRLLALQGICWPATQITLSLFEHQKRPLIVWALIGTTTCCSRSVQIWATSNLWWETRVGVGSSSSSALADASPAAAAAGSDVNGKPDQEVLGNSSSRRGYWRRWGGKWGGRRWDWKEVSIKCVLPAGIMYFLTAWAELLRREWER
ncbi:hypothetical protein M378DRAFT_87435 [Amanita muscaria Koide BX008]|uniref:N-glycosylation protein EOS1 n=1 Tax=Amanita muscaria (strain Koide BX008) TaxID=946122 RepID=A0A0C2S4X9_AMAMK|nr:hypothetical protein M378DRAFT_87435 [Amanita muscaria Koide BX008]